MGIDRQASGFGERLQRQARAMAAFGIRRGEQIVRLERFRFHGEISEVARIGIGALVSIGRQVKAALRLFRMADDQDDGIVQRTGIRGRILGKHCRRKKCQRADEI